MCGMDVDLDDGGSCEEEKEEEFWIGEGVKMLPPPVAHSGGSAWGSRRDRCGCMACGAALILWNLCVVVASALLLAVVFSVVLLPAVLLLYAGFLCHSRFKIIFPLILLSLAVTPDQQLRELLTALSHFLSELQGGWEKLCHTSLPTRSNQSTQSVLDASSSICQYLDDNSCSALIILGFVMMSPLVVVAAAVFCGLLRRFRLLLFIQPITRAWYKGRLLDWAGSVHAWV